MNQVEKANQFSALHRKGSPLVLFNVWDAGTAKAAQEAGAKAIATSSWAVAEAQGYRDGEDIPLPFAEEIVARIAAVAELPLTVDFEGGYSENEDDLAANVSRLLALGVVGINFEDRVVKGPGLYPVERQARRIAAIRATADKLGIPLFINARTDLFLGRGGEPQSAIDEALERAAAYQEAGASGFFVPGLRDEKLIARVVERSELPVNLMVLDGVPAPKRLAELGVARISYGALPHIQAMSAFKTAAETAFA
ncbi:isocitrate lyase/phosphoenolpyruvate mutase family protein [Bosea sp. BK604]|uniref:isocitrate lyase/PEP mutase family protein n=1 Tax=Bosea sp. BK604 TaxID=2512180 RepID=UPI00104AF38D|nr:isocitrate lyase/phosphoenolpyruvate mutase family protein [Bosea sp. BK604]TCR60612.1 2-methylisocitrate lyase-like PEP mutase family enzyme [Bosea sp. BK604]